MLPRLVTGAPGIYHLPTIARRPLGGVLMDVCAFVGVAPRGPVREPVRDDSRFREDRPCVGPGYRTRRSHGVAVESFEEYQRIFGGFEGPGRLPYAVASFFDQGGRRAWVVRVVHDYAGAAGSDGEPLDEGGVATGRVAEGIASSGDLVLRARSEGGWGDGLRASFGFATAPLVWQDATTTQITLDVDTPLARGSLLRIVDAAGATGWRFVGSIRRERSASGGADVRQAMLDLPLADTPVSAEIVEGLLLLDDGDGRSENHEHLGLCADHPRWLATVLCHESELAWPDTSWVQGSIVPRDPDLVPAPPVLPPTDPPQFAGGVDRYGDITSEDFFDASWVHGDPEPGSGVHALAWSADVSSVVTPDLYSPEPLAPQDALREDSLAGPDFAPCVEAVETELASQPIQVLTGLQLDPGLPDDLERITALQERLIELADVQRRWVVLLDVPPGIGHREILRWRSRFRSSYAAAYHPWLAVARPDDDRNALVLVSPAGVAAGVVAGQEHRFGVPHGPANVVATGIADVDVVVPPGRHDELHSLGINVWLRERDGVRLTAARTLSREPSLRQLSVRRLMLLLRRTLLQQMTWAVFEPNGPALRAQLRHQLRSFLGRLYSRGAFTGATESEAFFVRCDDQLNPTRIVDAGMLIAEIGVAPAEPVEFIVIRLTRTGDELRATEV